MLGSSQVKDTSSVFGLLDEKNSLTSSNGTLGLPSPKEGGKAKTGGQNERKDQTGKWRDRKDKEKDKKVG